MAGTIGPVCTAHSARSARMAEPLEATGVQTEVFNKSNTALANMCCAEVLPVWSVLIHTGR